MNITSLVDGILEENGLNDQASSPALNIASFKRAISSLSETIHQTYDPQESSVKEFTSLRAQFIDRILTIIWHHYFDDNSNNATLVAVGGYGRGELFPGSDIDLMLLTKRVQTQAIRDAIQTFLMFLWDIGLEVGHSVRTVNEVSVEARADITVITNLMEARFLTGNKKLYDNMGKACRPSKVWSSRAFFLGKMEEQQNRHNKFEDTGYKLEPNIKESPGGLRDIQNIAWVAKRHFNVSTLKTLIDLEYLTADECEVLTEGMDFLGSIRMSLHLLTGRREDRLLFDHQRKLAVSFGFEGEGNEKVEAFMQHYFRTVVELQRLNEMLLQHFQDDIDLKPRWGIKKIKRINSRFQTRRGYLEVIDDTVFEQFPFALLEVFHLLQMNTDIKGVTAATIRLIRKHRDDIDDEFRNDIRAKSYFMDILRQPHGITHELRRMNRYGILAAYLPEFENIVGRMQYDLFHTYTVDEHTLFVIRNLRRFALSKHKSDHPLCNQIMATLPKQELIYIAGLYHDIAKGRGGDHAILGAVDARDFCLRHGLGQYDANLVSWLVENHLLMSQTSQKQDIADAEVIHRFASKVGESVRLNYLFVLTVADMKATNPSLWNDWKSNLLIELYNATNRLYRLGMVSEDLLQDRLRARAEESREALVKQGITREQVNEFWDRLPDEYFLRHAVQDITWQTAELIQRNYQPVPLVCSRGDSQRGITVVFIYAPDQANLFAHCASALAELRLNITDARILETNDGYALNTYIVHDEHGNAILDQGELRIIEKRIQKEISKKDAPASSVKTRIPRTLKNFTVKSFIDFEQDKNGQRTILRLVTVERPAILSRVGQVFIENNIRLHNARIATFGERVEDAFFITTPDKKPITDEASLEKLRNEIIETLAND